MFNLFYRKLMYLVLTTVEDKKNANKISDSLLLEKLIPCVSFKNIESHFWWEGEINHSKEVQLIIKCKKKNINKVCNKIIELHSYKLPEIIFFPVSATEKYQNWVDYF